MINLSLIPEKIISERRTEPILVSKNNSIVTIKVEDECSYTIHPIASKSKNILDSNKLYIYICRKSHTSYFDEYITSLDIVDIEIHYEKMMDLQHIKYSGNIIFLVMFDLDDNLFSLNLSTQNCYIFNMEQMTILNRYLAIKQFYDAGFNLLGYSKVHAQCFPKEIYLPYQYNEEEINCLKSYSQEILYDVCIIPCNSAARSFIFYELKRLGVNIIDVTGWGEERDKKIGQCKIILNIHFQENYQIYEHLRCDRWMFAGKTIISEDSLDCEKLKLTNVHFYPYSELVMKTIEHLNTFDTSKNEDNQDMSQIIKERKSCLNEFLKKIDCN